MQLFFCSGRGRLVGKWRAREAGSRGNAGSRGTGKLEGGSREAGEPWEAVAEGCGGEVGQRCTVAACGPRSECGEASDSKRQSTAEQRSGGPSSCSGSWRRAGRRRGPGRPPRCRPGRPASRPPRRRGKSPRPRWRQAPPVCGRCRRRRSVRAPRRDRDRNAAPPWSAPEDWPGGSRSLALPSSDRRGSCHGRGGRNARRRRCAGRSPGCPGSPPG